MKTLHKIFHKGLFLNSLKGLVFSFVAVFFSYAYGKAMGEDSAFYNLTFFIAIVIAIQAHPKCQPNQPLSKLKKKKNFFN